MRDIRAIRNEADYDWALAELETYFSQPPNVGSTEADRFDVLAALVEAYEMQHWSIEPADPIEAIKSKMEMVGYSQKDLAGILGSASRASDVLNRKRALTIEMIRQIAAAWKIPADILVHPYRLSRAA